VLIPPGASFVVEKRQESETGKLVLELKEI
jgi:hypothetical protein